MLMLGAFGVSVGGILVAACSSRAAAIPVGSSASAVTSVGTADGGAQQPHSVSTAAGHATNPQTGLQDTDQLTVWQGLDTALGDAGIRFQNYYSQRWLSSAMTVYNATSTWGGYNSLVLADGHYLDTYTGPVKVAYLNEPGKFVIASGASSILGSASNPIDVVLVTTINGGTSWNLFSALSGFYGQDSYTKGPGGSITGAYIESISMAVDPNKSVYNEDNGGNSYHDVYITITTLPPEGVMGQRLEYDYEFWVTSGGDVVQLAPSIGGPDTGGGEWRSIAYDVDGPCSSGTCAPNVDTLSVVFGQEKSCNGGYQFLFGMWASNNPLDDGHGGCSITNTYTVDMTWTGLTFVDYDADGANTSYGLTVGPIDNVPDCIGKQVNWPAAALAYDPTVTMGPGGGNSVTYAMSIPDPAGSSYGQQVNFGTTGPIGCSGGAGTACTNCCTTTSNWGCLSGDNPPSMGPTTGCKVNGVVMDCNSTACVNAGSNCTPVPGAAQILPALAYESDDLTPPYYLSVAWYDNRDGGGSPASFGEIRAMSSSDDMPQGFPSATSSIVPYSAEGTQSTNSSVNECIGFAVQNESLDFFGASSGSSTIFNWQYKD
jgi:hypothetical protein